MAATLLLLKQFLQRGRGLCPPPCVTRADSAATRELCCNCPAPRPPQSPPLQSQLKSGGYSGSCIPPQASTPTLPVCHATWPHASPTPAREAWPCSSFTARAGFTHAHPAARHAGPCAAMARCPLPGTVRPVHGPADGSRVGARRGVRAPAGA